MNTKIDKGPLLQLGLTESEIQILLMLYELGGQTARDLVQKTGQTRAYIYAILASLRQKNLVLEIKGAKTIYEPTASEALLTLAKEKLTDANKLQREIEGLSSELNHMYKLAIGKPTVQIFEGLEGVETALNDSLTSSTEILTYFDPSSITGEIAEINKRYVEKRLARKISKRIILPNNQSARNYVASTKTDFTRVALSEDLSEVFQTATEIYDDKVLFLTLTKEKIIAVIIEEENIANAQRAQFEYIWKKETASSGV